MASILKVDTLQESTSGGGVNFSHPAELANGTAAAPSLAFTSDSDTGLYSSAANQISIATGGVERFRIESTGQIKAVYESQVGTDYNTTMHNGYFCRAWVNFNGQGAISIRASGNISSITDNGTSDYNPNFTVSMPDANYVITSIGYHEGGVTEGPVDFYQGTQTTSTFKMQFRGNAGSPDPQTMMVAIFR